MTLTLVSSGIDPEGWRQWWSDESHRVGTDWDSILQQHLEVLHQLGIISGEEDSFDATCRDADARKTSGKPPCHIEPWRWRERPEHAPSNWNELSLDALWSVLDRAAHERNPAPEKSTVAAIIVAVQRRGLGALKEPATAERLARCTPDQRDDIKRRIASL